MLLDHDEQLKRLVIEWELAIPGVPIGSVDDWASSELQSLDPHSLVYELFDRQADSHQILKQIAKDRLGFVPFSPEGHRVIAEIVREILRRYLDREMTPMELCRLAFEFDAFYLDRVSDDHPTPGWVAHLYNACDWCDDSWDHEVLVEIVDRVLRDMPTK
jgi:hypothetical protein